VIDDVYFLTVEEVVAVHADQIDRYGGDLGLRDRGLLESAVHAAQNVAAYIEDCDLCDLAAAYIFHLAENQPFVDGNKPGCCSRCGCGGAGALDHLMSIARRCKELLRATRSRT